MASWQLLDVDDENQLHKSRLFSIEEKPFKRITKRLGAINGLANSKVRQVLTPPPESNGDQAASSSATREAPALDLAQLKEDITFDFAAFDGTIARLQFLLSANEKQREKYAAERVQILDTCQSVRDNTTQLRGQLDQARATLAQRKKFDKLAEKISNNKLLRVRSEQEANLLKLEEECRQLEAESETYAGTWLERKEQFSRIMDESMRLRSIIRDEKEEVERREGMDDEGGDGGAGDAEGEASQTPRPGIASGNATPRPDSGAASAVPRGLDSGDGSGTPAAASTGGRTPMRDSPAPSGHEGLKPLPDASGSFSQNGSRGPSREGSPARDTEEGEDVVMDESARAGETPIEGTQGEDTPRITVEGQEVDDDKMDTT
ncbi:putative tho complex subunit 7 protein [Phaeoacremonium minimum UCRPA7]|uniref:Putative tho complex subunit 7 protein n=1 Tax=Phaeoacremonium minimum (strain UCR-PA7) TaxID=1286976 RepID=R8BY59_PHAM7|nr:putative tho complex subunit 7 protein [Phaeoacremonium minimum UCRPA7]EOO04331.1 putative tho complex subunit 7 protein [Phaeoacremonium minimum UCRPA7]